MPSALRAAVDCAAAQADNVRPLWIKDCRSAVSSHRRMSSTTRRQDVSAAANANHVDYAETVVTSFSYGTFQAFKVTLRMPRLFADETPVTVMKTIFCVVASSWA
jgi:hypothetical protein